MARAVCMASWLVIYPLHTLYIAEPKLTTKHPSRCHMPFEDGPDQNPVIKETTG